MHFGYLPTGSAAPPSPGVPPQPPNPPTPSSHAGRNARCPLWGEPEPSQGCSRGRMWPRDRCNHGSRHHPLGRSLSPAPVITAGGRKEGNPPGTEALAPGSLYSPLQLLLLPSPGPRPPQAQGAAPPPPACPCSLPSPPRTHVCCLASRPARSSPAYLPSSQQPTPAAVPSRMMGKCAHLGVDRPGCIPSLAPTSCVTLGNLFTLCRL